MPRMKRFGIVSPIGLSRYPSPKSGVRLRTADFRSRPSRSDASWPL